MSNWSHGREWNMEPEDVTESLWCKICLQRLPSDEEKCINHLIDEHGFDDVPYMRNIARLYIADFKNWTVSNLLDNEPLKEPEFRR